MKQKVVVVMCLTWLLLVNVLFFYGRISNSSIVYKVMKKAGITWLQ